MKNSGFTLVELLAVIVILAVLALIATPVVLSIIDDAKESAMLRSAEMYLSGVENAVMRENMNSGGNFRPSECEILNGNMTCGTTNVEVEVDGEVPSTGTIVFENGKIKEVTLNYTSGTIVKDESGNLVYEGSQDTGKKVEITPKKEIYTIGEEVTIGEESFYVIADDTEKVTLLAKYNLNKAGTAQLNADHYETGCVFSSTNYWSSETQYPLNLNDYPIPEGVTSAITIAKAYGISLGGTGRLMIYEEANELKENYGWIIYSLYYWLGSANSSCDEDCSDPTMHVVAADDMYLSGSDHDHDNYFGIRPVVEISKSKIN